MVEIPSAAVDRVVTSGVIRRDSGAQDVETNVWIVGEHRRVILIDPALDHFEIVRALGDREVMAILCTHGHGDHIDAAAEIAALTDAPILLHPGDEPLWNAMYPDRPTDAPLLDGEVLRVGAIELRVVQVPGHTPGSVCVHAPELGVVFTGDSLPTQAVPGEEHPCGVTVPAQSGQARLRGLSGDTIVCPGHREPTTLTEVTQRMAGDVETG